MANNTYSSLSPRTTAYVVRDLLKRGMPWMTLEKFGQAKPLPANSTKSIEFRRYYLKPDTSFTWPSGSPDFNPHEYFKDTMFDPSSRTLTEGTTPSAHELSYSDYTATLSQYGSARI